MTNPHSFRHILGTSTLLVFALSFNAFNIQASEAGSHTSAFLFEEPSIQRVAPTLTAARVREIRHKEETRVMGYTVGAAVTGVTNQLEANTTEGTSSNGTTPIVNPQPTPLPSPVPTPEPEPTPSLSITVTSPNGGESWKAGSTYTVTWQSTGIPQNFDGIVQIDLYQVDDNQLVDTKQVLGNPGSASFKVRPDAESDDDYKIRLVTCSPVTGSAGYQCYGSPYYATDDSDATFTVIQTKTVKQIKNEITQPILYHERNDEPRTGNPNAIVAPGAIKSDSTVREYVTKTFRNESQRQERIQALKERIKKLEYELSEVEKSVVERERMREKTVNTELVNRVAGKLLIQPESKGEVWYVDPATKQKFYLKDGESAYQALKAFGTGISETDFNKLENKPFARQLIGKIILRVQSHGEAYYIDEQGVAHYLQNGDKAYEIMRSKALGIKNDDIASVPTGTLEANTDGTSVSQ